MAEVNTTSYDDAKRFKKAAESDVKKSQNVGDDSSIVSRQTSTEDKSFSLEFLPDDNLMAIFNFLAPKDLLNLTLVCKRLNDVISSSGKLLSSFVMKISTENEDEPWIGVRKYSNIDLKYIDVSKILSKLNFIGNSINNLGIFWNTLNVDVLSEIFTNVGNLRSLNMSFNNLSQNEVEKPLPKVNLDKLRLDLWFYEEKAENLVKLFANCAIKNLQISSRLKDEIVVEDVKKLLISHSELEDLSIYDETLFNDDKLNVVNFKLKTLTCFCDFNYRDPPNLPAFLENHKNSMNYLKIYMISDVVADALNNYTNLETLIVQGRLSKRLKLFSVKNLEISHDSKARAVQFPNVKNLKISKSKFKNIVNLECLENLTLDSVNFGELFLPTVSVLTLIRMSNAHKKPFKFEGSSLEELNLIHCTLFPPNWLAEYIQRDETKLKKLTVRNCTIFTETQTAIEANKGKVGQLLYVDNQSIDKKDLTSAPEEEDERHDDSSDEEPLEIEIVERVEHYTDDEDDNDNDNANFRDDDDNANNDNNANNQSQNED